MNHNTAIEAVVAKTGCSRDEALEALKQTSYDIASAVERVKSAAPREICITKYTDGLLVDGTFYDYAVGRNRELLEMLERNEFDEEVLGLNSGTVDVIVEEKYEKYPYDLKEIKDQLDSGERHKRIKTQEKAQPRGRRPNEEYKKTELSIPESVDLTGQRPCSTVKFKLCNNKQVFSFIAPAEMFIGDLLQYLHEITGHSLRLSKRNEVLDEKESINVLDRCMVDIIV